MGSVDPPPDVGLFDPFIQSSQVLSTEMESVSHRCQAQEVSNFGRSEATRQQRHQRAEHPQQRHLAARAAIRDPVAQRRRSFAERPRVVFGGRSQHGLDHRREVLHSRAKDGDVAFGERGIGREEVQQRVSQCFDLTGHARA